MSAPERFAKRKALDLRRVESESTAQLQERPQPEALASTIDQILDARARDRFSERMHESKMVLLRTVAVPFGLGHLVSAYDRIGGDVHTVNNVRNGVYASEAKRQEYENRGDYKVVKGACRGTKSYEEAKEAGQLAHKNGTFVDPYTGKGLPPSQPVPDTDHTVSAHELFHDPGRVLAGIDTPTLSTIPENLNSTHQSINRSKGEKSAEEFLARIERIREKQRVRVATLEAKGELTEDEQKELRSRKALLNVDADRMREKDAQAREAIDDKINWEWYTSLEFAGEVLGSSVESAAKTGVVAAFGEFLVEFLAACYDEARDWYLHGTSGKPVFQDLKQRLERVAERVVARKQAAWQAFKAGSLAGFIASLISVIINAFKTTQKRVQRMLREGSQALVRMVSLLIRPSEGMSTRESLYAATHLVMATGVVMGGIALEELLEDAIKTKLPVLVFIAEPLAVVLSGVVAGLTVVLTASLLDRWDPYGVVEEQDLLHAIDQLSSEMEEVWGAGTALAPK